MFGSKERGKAELLRKVYGDRVIYDPEYYCIPALFDEKIGELKEEEKTTDVKRYSLHGG